MGLFDIFRRRSKKNQDEKKEKPAEPETQAPESDSESAESSASAAQANSTAEPASEVPASDVGEASSEKPQVKETASASAEAAPDDAKAPDSQAADSAEATARKKAASISTPAPSQDNVAVDTETEGKLEKPESTVTPTSSQAAGSSSAASVPDDSATEETATTTSYEKGLAKSRSSFGQKLNALLANFRHVDEGFFDDLEDMLIESDVGFDMSMRIADELREEVKLKNAKKPKDVQNVIVEKMIDLYDQAGNGENAAINMAKSGPTVILMVGVNGVGKTTTIGKMAKMYKDQGKKVVLAAADTFRAGAIEQLNVWAERDGVEIVKSKPKSDPSSVVFDAVRKARDENYDILMVDTAGRLQNKVNLMNELSKMKKILTREIPEAPHEVLLVLDATTGQNAMTQAKMFKEATNVTGIVLTKLDGTARGGIVLAIRSELHLPVKYVGLGEKVTDLKPFDPNDFVYGLFKGLISE